jgi:uncharacterized protein YdhG (YjbR/CyaY superfamily)
MSEKPNNIDQYLATLPDDRRATLENLRRSIQTAAPRAEETFSYGIPAFRLDGRTLIWFAAWKQHYSIYPMSEAVRHEHRVELEGFETSKGTIRFPADEPLPFDLISRLVKARIVELKKRGK